MFPIACSYVAVLRWVTAVRARRPEAAVEVGGRQRLCRATLYGLCEGEGPVYIVGLVPNPLLEVLAAPLLAKAERPQAEWGGEKVRLVGEAVYAALNWSREEHIFFKPEVLVGGRTRVS